MTLPAPASFGGPSFADLVVHVSLRARRCAWVNFLGDDGNQLDPRASPEMGCEMVMLKKGDCEHCGRFYRYTLWHSGFGDNSFAYCDDCGILALLNYSNQHVAALPAPADRFGEIENSWEPLLQPCPCGGSFRKGALPRCPSCRQKLSATHAAAHIEAQALGARGWKWQNNWGGIYCIAMIDPLNPGSVLQVIDPVAKPERAAAKRRWPLLFSFGR